MKQLAILVCLVAAALCMADSQRAVKKELDGHYRAVTKAFQTKNIDSIAGLLTDDYTAVQPNGQVSTKAQVLQDFRNQAAAMHDLKWRRVIRSLTLNGDQAIALVDGDFKGHLAMGGTKMHEMEFKATTLDTWTKTPAGYRLQKSEVKSAVATMDGKPMPAH